MPLAAFSGVQVTGLHHAQITVPRGREDEARVFYCGVLGLPEIPKPAALAGRGGFWLALPGLQLHVGAEDGVERTATKAHLAYAVSDLETARAALVAHGLEVLSVSPLPGMERFESRDPFGNRLEFIHIT